MDRSLLFRARARGRRGGNAIETVIVLSVVALVATAAYQIFG